MYFQADLGLHLGRTANPNKSRPYVTRTHLQRETKRDRETWREIETVRQRHRERERQ